MELDENIKEDLKCSNCENYLTCTPIMVRPNGDSICGRCSPLQEEKHLVVRNNAYEKLASTIKFPCRYKENGCNFSSFIVELEEHELYCVYHKFKCPVLPSRSCPWIGSREELVEHFQENHPDLFLQHPCNVKPNILTKNCEKNMLTSFSNKLFLVQSKYNVSSAKFWHNVRLIDNPKLTKHYEYSFEVLSERGNLLQKYDVLEQEFFQIYDDPQKQIDLNNLLSLLGRFDNLNFQITIKEKENVIHCTDCKIGLSVADANGALCGDCSKITDVVNYSSTNYKCKKCGDGCLYNDSFINVSKHEMWFCEYVENVCAHCKNNVSNLFNHFFNNHRGTIYSDVMHMKNLSLNTDYSSVLILNDVIFLCLWNFKTSYLEFKIISNVPKTENEKFDCILKMINPRNEFQKKYKLAHYKDDVNYDWLAYINPDTNNPIVGLITESVQTGQRHRCGYGSNTSNTSVHSRYSFELKVVMKS